MAVIYGSKSLQKLGYPLITHLQKTNLYLQSVIGLDKATVKVFSNFAISNTYRHMVVKLTVEKRFALSFFRRYFFAIKN